MLWQLRLRPNVREVFAALLGSPELIVSLDGFAGTGTTRWSNNNFGQLHVDPNPFAAGCQPLALQSLLSLTQETKDSPGTTIVAGSRNHVAKAYKGWKFRTGEDWCTLNSEGLVHLGQKGCAILHLEMDPGDLVVWLAHTTHAVRLCRHRITECFAANMTFACSDGLKTPGDTARFKRRAMGLNDRNEAVSWPHTTSHHPEDETCFPRDGKGLQRTPDIALTNEALQLAGILPYPSRGEGDGGGGEQEEGGAEAVQATRENGGEAAVIDLKGDVLSTSESALPLRRRETAEPAERGAGDAGVGSIVKKPKIET